VRVNEFLIGLSKGLFSYQIFVRARALPTVTNLLVETIDATAHLKSVALRAGEPVSA
jgi:hypothetical protein